MIDEMMKWGKAPVNNGLGFIFIHEPNTKVRWNFYDPDLTPVMVPDYHTHRIEFESRIIKGGLHQQIVDVHPVNSETDLHLLETSCITGKLKGVVKENVKVSLKHYSYHPVNSWYITKPMCYHRVWVQEPTITRVTILHKDSDYNYTVKSKKKKFDCPLNDYKKSERECWEIIRTFF